MDSDQAAFLKARLDEEEAAALAAGGGVHCQEWDASPAGYQEGRVEDGHGDVVVYDEGSPTLAQAQHIARHDPARALREVTAIRSILELAGEADGRDLPEGVHDGRDPDERECDETIKGVLEDVVRTLAAIYSDHPDYLGR